MPILAVAPGAVHVSGWLSPQLQRAITEASREWAAPPAGIQATRMRNGSLMSVQTVCLGWHWVPYRYSRFVQDEVPVKPMPGWLADLGREAVSSCFESVAFEPDVAMINYYDADARMGMHQDREELSPAPVVSLSIGDSCLFRLGNTENRNKPCTDVLLDSGDLLIFGGPARLAYHGVPKILPGTGPADTGLGSGRLNITLRESGLVEP